jgi:perosamine synthetase
MNPEKKYWYDVVGFNYRMTNIQAAIGIAQLKKIDEFIKKKRSIAKYYMDTLKDLARDGQIILHPEMPWAKCVYWMYSILLNDNFGIDRDKLIQKLYDRGIETRPFFYPLHTTPPYKTKGKYPVSENISIKGINLPTGGCLTPKQIKDINYAIRN